MKKYLALFDLDGTLFDTREVNYYAYKDALAYYNIELDKEYFVSQCNGRHYTEFLPIIMGNMNYIEEVHTLKKDTYVNNLKRARKNIHLFELIGAMINNYHTAVVTTASKKNATDILMYFGLGSLFEYIVSQEDVTAVKPDPEGFLIAMEHFGIDADHTVIFEDSDVGIIAAKKTGSSVMSVAQF